MPRKKKPTKPARPAGRIRRYRIDDRQVGIVLKSLIEFGYKDLTFEEVRRIANEVADGTFDSGDPVPRIIARQIDEGLGPPGTGRNTSEPLPKDDNPAEAKQ